jgi:hypothetical protein
MTDGAGIAVAGIWIAVALIGINRHTTGIGLTFALIAGVVATFIVR